MKRLLITICGRAGSKGFKNKNLKNFCGKPLVYYSLSAAELFIKKHPELEIDVALNTDSEDLARLVAAEYPEVIYLPRGAELGGDRVPKVEVYKDSFARMEARTLPRSTPQLEILACVVGSAGFAYLFGGTLADMPVAAVAGLLEALVCQQFARHGINRIFTDIVAAFCGTIWAIAVQTVVPAVNANAAIIGALMVLTPGVALTMGVRDILNGDYLSGSIRLLDALLIAGSIAGGVVLGWIMARGLEVA